MFVQQLIHVRLALLDMFLIRVLFVLQILMPVKIYKNTFKIIELSLAPPTGSGDEEELSETSFVTQATSATNIGRPTSDSTTQVAAIVGNGDPVGVQALISGKIFFCIQYLNITYSKDVLTILKKTAPTPGKGDPDYVPNISDSIESDLTKRGIPYAFHKYGLSSTFVLNFWKDMIFLLMIFAVLLLALFVELLIKKFVLKCLPISLAVLARGVVQNYLLTQFYSFLGDAVLFSTLQYRTIQFHSTSEGIDLFLSIIFLLAVFSVPVWHSIFLIRYWKVKKSSESKEDKDMLKKFQKSHPGVKLFYDDFNDKFKLQQLFLVFLATRDLIFNLLLTTLFNHPLPQIIIFLVMNIAMIAYIAVRNPFKQLINLIQQIFYEILLFIALVVLIILITLDMQHSTNYSARDILGKILIVESLLYSYGTIIITSISILMVVAEFIKKHMKKKSKPTQVKYLSTEEAPITKSKKLFKKPRGLTLETEGESSKNKDLEGLTSLPTSGNTSPQNKLLPHDTQFSPRDSEPETNRKIIKLNSGNPDDDDNDRSEMVDQLHIDSPRGLGSSSPTHYIISSPHRKFQSLRSMGNCIDTFSKTDEE